VPPRQLVLAFLLLAGGWLARPPGPHPGSGLAVPAECSGTTVPMLFGLLTRPLTLAEMVNQLERGCLVLDEVRFRPGTHALQEFSAAGFAQVARAIGLAQGAYRIAVPAEAMPGWPPDTVQALRRGGVLRDQLVRSGASLERLLEEPGVPPMPLLVGRGGARPMLVRVQDHPEPR
jgi:hypothetical protein